MISIEYFILISIVAAMFCTPMLLFGKRAIPEFIASKKEEYAAYKYQIAAIASKNVKKKRTKPSKTQLVKVSPSGSSKSSHKKNPTR
jgi:hypothetical protein